MHEPVPARARWTRAIERRYPPRGRFVRIERGRMHLLERMAPGADGATAAVLLHGASGNACDLGLELFDALAMRRRTLSIDRPGHGWSDRPGGARDADPHRQAVLVRQALRALGVARAIVVAHSWSGGLALDMALGQRDLVAGVVLVGAATHPWPGGKISWYHRLAAHPRCGDAFARIAAPLGRPLLERVLRRVFLPQRPPPGFVDRTALPLLFRPSQFRANSQDMAKLHEFLAAQAPRYAELAVPVTTIVGDADRIVPMAHGVALAGQSSWVRLRVVRGMGHMLQHADVAPIVAAVEELATRAALPRRIRVS